MRPPKRLPRSLSDFRSLNSRKAFVPTSTLSEPAGAIEAAAPSGSTHSPANTGRLSFGLIALFALVPLCFLVYATSFRGIPVLEREHSVLADADAANFALIISDFAMDKRYGDEYNTVGRSIGDIAQKHKIHHVAYGAVGEGLYRVTGAAYRIFGMPQRAALYAVNAIVTCANILLLYFLLRGHNPRRNPLLPFLVFYAAALSTWIYGSIPESWPFSTTLALGFLLLLQRRRVPALGLGLCLGLIMLNNILLASLGLLVMFHLHERTRSWRRTVVQTTIAAVATVATWVVAMTGLSVYDIGFRPDHFIAYTLWFKDYVGSTLPVYSPYVWKSAITNLFVNSVVANQPDATVPQETLLLTIRGSVLGATSVALYLLLASGAAFKLLRSFYRDGKDHGFAAALGREANVPMTFAAIVLAFTAVGFFSGAILYSTLAVPMIALILFRQLDLNSRWMGLIFYAFLLVMVANNLQQIVSFRETLLALG